MHQALGRIRTWSRLEREGRLPPAALEALQVDRLRRILSHAQRQVPFYRKLFASAGIQPESVHRRDLQHLPIVRRTEVQAAPLTDLVADGLELARCVQRHTGGSSGRPLTVVSSRDDLAVETLLWLRTWRRLGLRWGDRQVTVKDPDDAAPWNKKHWFQRLGILRIAYLDVHAPLEELAQSLVAARPDILRAPPSILDAIARTHADVIGSMRPRLLFTTSEWMATRTRTLLETTFGAPVRDLYGATEAGCIAWRCPHCDAYHVNSDAVLVEVVRDGVPVGVGETGEVVITNLCARAMPFIRYALGDLAQLGEPCPASPGGVTLRSLQGRSVAPVVVGDGTRLSPYTFMPDDVPGIAEYRILQERPDAIRVLVVAGAGFRPESLAFAERQCRQRVGRKCQVVFELRDALPPRSGHDVVVQERTHE